MDIELTIKVSVDPAKWDREYGNGASPAEVRADVTDHLQNTIVETLRVADRNATATVR